VVAQLGFLQDREQMIANAKTMCELQNYLIAKIREREAEPREDLISDLVHARTEDDENPTLSFEEKVSSVRAMLIAGNETTASAIANMFYVLATEPETPRCA
jgi:cytochrome P450